MNSENGNMLSDLGDLTAYGDFSILPFDITTLNPNQYTQLSLNTDKSSQLVFFFNPSYPIYLVDKSQQTLTC